MKKVFKVLLIPVFILLVFSIQSTNVNAEVNTGSSWWSQPGENLTTNTSNVIESIPDGANGTSIANKRYAISNLDSMDSETIPEEKIEQEKSDYYLNFYKVQIVFNNMKPVMDANDVDTGEFELDPNYDFTNTPTVNYGHIELDTNMPNMSGISSPELSCQLTYSIGLNSTEDKIGAWVTGDDIFMVDNGRLLIELDTSMDIVTKPYIRKITKIAIRVGRDNLEYDFGTNILFQYTPYSTYKDSKLQSYIKYTDTRSENPVTINNWYTLFKTPSPRTIATFTMNDIQTGNPIENVSSIHAVYDYQYLDQFNLKNPFGTNYTDKVTYEATVKDFLNQVRTNFNSTNTEKTAWNEFWSNDFGLDGYAGLINDKYKSDTLLNAEDKFTPTYMWVWNGMKITNFQPLYATQTIEPGVISYHSFLTDGATIVNLEDENGNSVTKVIDASGQIRDDMAPMDAGNSSRIIYIDTGKEVESVVDAEYTSDPLLTKNALNIDWLNNLSNIGNWMTDNFTSIVSSMIGILGMTALGIIFALIFKAIKSIFKLITK